MDAPAETPSTVSPPPTTPAPLQPEPPVTKNRWPLVLGVLIILIVLLISGWLLAFRIFSSKLKETKIATPNVDRIKAAGKIVVGTDPTFAPMEFINDNGEYAGYDVELINRIADKLGVKTEFKTIPFDDFITLVNNHDVDIVVSSISITDERKQLVEFSDPYLNAGQIIITRKDDNSIRSTVDLKGKRIAVQRGTTNEEKAKELTTPDLVVPFDDFIEATQAVLTASADALFSDLTGAKGIITANPSLKVASEPFTLEQYGIVFPKGEHDFVTEVNNIINELRQQGILAFLKQKWLD